MAGAGKSLTEHDIRVWVTGTLAPFKVAAHFEFVESLPYNETGKVMKRLLK